MEGRAMAGGKMIEVIGAGGWGCELGGCNALRQNVRDISDEGFSWSQGYMLESLYERLAVLYADAYDDFLPDLGDAGVKRPCMHPRRGYQGCLCFSDGLCDNSEGVEGKGLLIHVVPRGFLGCVVCRGGEEPKCLLAGRGGKAREVSISGGVPKGLGKEGTYLLSGWYVSDNITDVYEGRSHFVSEAVYVNGLRISSEAACKLGIDMVLSVEGVYSDSEEISGAFSDLFSSDENSAVDGLVVTQGRNCRYWVPASWDSSLYEGWLMEILWKNSGGVFRPSALISNAPTVKCLNDPYTFYPKAVSDDGSVINPKVFLGDGVPVGAKVIREVPLFTPLVMSKLRCAQGCPLPFRYEKGIGAIPCTEGGEPFLTEYYKSLLSS